MSLKSSDTELAKRYRWFCNIGYNTTVLNDPKIILKTATPEHVDKLIIKGMKEFSIINPDGDNTPMVA